MEEALSLDLAEFERERKMPYVSSIERIAREEGKSRRQSGRQERRQNRGQGRDPAEVAHQATRNPRPRGTGGQIRSTGDLAKLDAWIDAGLEAADLADFRRMAGI